MADPTLAVSDFESASRRRLFLDPAPRTTYLVDPRANGLERLRY